MTIVVGGHSRNIGKTAVLCGIIEGLRELDWTAIKITQYGHGVCSKKGVPCNCADPRRPICITEETTPDPATDSGRYLLAGAEKCYWVRTPKGRLAEAMPGVREIAASSPNLIIESNSVLGFIRPDICAMVMDGSVPDFKASSLNFLDRADLIVPTSTAPLHWKGISPMLLEGKLQIPVLPPDYRSPDLIAKIRAAISPG